MSLSKELCLRSDSENRESFSDRQNSHSLIGRKEDNQRRDSFDDRFCDDLCEDIIQYLPLKDKFKLECVSKQFQRTVYKRQYVLYINTSPELHNHYLDNKYEFVCHKRVHNYYYIEDQSLHSFEALLKKFPNIKTINLSTRFRGDVPPDPDKINQVFRLIIDNCNNLIQFTLFPHINVSNFEEFHRKFGPQIKTLGILRQFNDLQRFPNIERISISNDHSIDDLIVPQLNLAKVKNLDMIFNHGQDILQTLIDNFPKLKRFHVIFNFKYENAIYKPLKNISNLKHLIHFSYIEVGLSNIRFLGLLKQMANKCRNLKSIGCHFKIDGKNSDMKQLLSHLKAFPLKRLNLYLYFIYNEVEDNIDVNQLFSFELFKGFSNITHLSYQFEGIKTPKDWTLKEIDISLPKLQYFQIEYPIDTTPEGVTQMADNLSRLSRLETLKLLFESGVDYKPIGKKITEKCRKIRKIEIKTF